MAKIEGCSEWIINSNYIVMANYNILTPEKIKELLDQSGYLFEQKVASVIEQLGFHTLTNRAYFDLEENKSREIDIVAHKSIFEIQGSPRISGICYLNCECKNSKTPYIFIMRKKGFLDKYWKPDGIFLIKDQEDHKQFYTLGLEKDFFATRKEIKSVQLCKITNNGKKFEVQHSGIIENFIYPLMKSKAIWETQAPQSTFNHRYCKFFFNLAIINSAIYTINSEEENSLPIETKFVPFIREIRTNDFDGYFLTTFVTFSFLKEFIQGELEEFCKIVHRKYMENPALLSV